jgi:hypothetical protein
VTNYLKILINRTGNKTIFIVTLFFVLSFSAALSQNQQSKPTRQSALDAFSKGNYEIAYSQFSVLSDSYPRDPLYKYYCGVSLVKLERDPVKASSLIKEAIQGSAAIRSIPSDGLFYMGRAQQLCGNFSEAIKSYNLYTEQVGKKTSKENLTQQFIQQCNERKGAIVLSGISKVKGFETDSIYKVNNETAISVKKYENNNSDSIIRNEKSLPPEYEKLSNDALNYQFRADSLMKLADIYRKQLENVPIAEKPTIKSKISETEQLADVNQKFANEKLVSLADLTKSKTGNDVLQEKKNKLDSVSAKTKIRVEVFHNGAGVIKDTLVVKKEETPQNSVVGKIDNQVLKDTVNKVYTKEKIVTAQPKTIELYSMFEVAAKPTYAANEKVKINPEVPVGLIYRIKIGSFRNPLAPSYFKGINPIWGFRSEGAEVTDYYAGMFRKSADAYKALIKVKGVGFKDAFVVALLDKKGVSAERASTLEKEWGNKPFAWIQVRKIPDTSRDTIPPTLVFRVEVTKSLKPLTTEQLDNIKRLAGNRGLDIIKNSSGQNIYLIGKFLTFESAAEYADLLTRNGQKEARVTAYLGRREISVETAKGLFEKF